MASHANEGPSEVSDVEILSGENNSCWRRPDARQLHPASCEEAL